MNSETLALQTDDDLVRSFSFLLKAYDFSSEHLDQSVPIWDVGRIMGITEAEAEEIASDLQEMNLVYYSSLAGDIALTSFGMSEIVLAQSQPLQPTTHFPPLSTMSGQLMLPLSVGSSHPSVLRLVDQLESFHEELCVDGASKYDLNDSMELLDQTLQESRADHQGLIDELDMIRLALS